jgi:hypothetical protein
LFQVLRDDFLSVLVRGCWLVSFFFTPIYMFLLIFLVMFGPKKGSITIYEPNWGFKFQDQIKTFTFKKNFIKNYYYNFQFTVVTSRLTSYFLFSFWLFFFFFGEILLLVILNYSTTCDSINSSCFMSIKQHIIFYLITIPVKLSYHINSYIYFLTSCSFFYMMNLSYSYSYRYLSQASLNNMLIFSLFILFSLFFLL